MKAIHLLLFTGFALFFATAGAQQQTKIESRQQVSLQEVKTAAVGALKSKTGVVIDTIFALKNKNENTLLYECRFRDGQAVLMSGSKACIPVLGYYTASEGESILDPDADIPDGLRWFLERFQEQIELCFANDTITLYEETVWQQLQSNTAVMAKAAPLPTGSVNVIVPPMLTTKWGQSISNDSLDCNAYNYYVSETSSSCNCNETTNNKCAAGCTSVAMAQIMNYWKYPIYNSERGRYYDWCNMKDELNANSFNSNYNKERSAIAHLISDCGRAANTRYCIVVGDCQSAANSIKAKGGFHSFGYSNASRRPEPVLYDNLVEWRTKIKNNIIAGRPVFMKGGTHSFVCDGWGTGISNGYNYYHFNWGWYGSYDNSWFTLDNIKPGDKDYNRALVAVVDIYPPSGHNIEDYCSFSEPLANYYSANPNTPPSAPSVFSVLESVPETALESWRTIPSGATAEYVAHDMVILKPGFTAKEGSEFVARIEPCTSCNNSTSNAVSGNDWLEEQEIEELYSPRSAIEIAEVGTAEIANRTAKLYQNTPNPFTGQTTIGYYLPEGSGSTWLRIMNPSGITVKTINIATSGEGSVKLDANALPPGIYFYSLLIDGAIIDTKRMVVE